MPKCIAIQPPTNSTEENKGVCIAVFSRYEEKEGDLFSILAANVADSAQNAKYYLLLSLSDTMTLDKYKELFEGKNIAVQLFDFAVSELFEDDTITGVKVIGNDNLEPITVFHRAWLTSDKSACKERLTMQLRRQIKEGEVELVRNKEEG